MSKVRINDLAREMEVKSRQILDVLAELGLAEGKTHSSSLEADEAEKVRAQFERGSRAASHSGAGSSRATQSIQPKIDLSHISKPGDALKAVLAKKQEDEAAARRSHVPVRPPATPQPQAPAKPAPPVVAVAHPPAAPARPEPRKIVPPVRQAPQIISAPPSSPAIASKPPAVPVVAKAPAAAAAPARPAVAVVPPQAVAVVKPPATPAVPPRAAEAAGAPKPVAAPVQPQISLRFSLWARPRRRRLRLRLLRLRFRRPAHRFRHHLQRPWKWPPLRSPRLLLL